MAKSLQQYDGKKKKNLIARKKKNAVGNAANGTADKNCIKEHAINLGGVLDGSANVAGVYFGSEAERVDRLVGAGLLGRDIDEHERLGASSESLLKQESELGVAERHVALLGREGHDDIAEVRQRLVDVLCLGQAITSGIGLLETFGSSQINHVENA